MKFVRSVKLYYRDESGVMRAIDGLRVIVVENRPEKVYTLPPLKDQELRIQ